jgi:hypothetical protein
MSSTRGARTARGPRTALSSFGAVANPPEDRLFGRSRLLWAHDLEGNLRLSFLQNACPDQVKKYALRGKRRPRASRLQSQEVCISRKAPSACPHDHRASLSARGLTLLCAWDDDKLPLELAQRQEMGLDLYLTGFSGDDFM